MTSPIPPAADDSPPTLYVRADHAAWRRIGDETVVLDQKAHRLVALNAAGGDLWHRLDAPRAAEHLASGDAAGVQSFLEKLSDLGLLERAQAGEAPRPANDAGPDQGDSVPKSSSSEAEPAILWQEAVQNAAQTSACAFLPAQNPLCDSVPFS